MKFMKQVVGMAAFVCMATTAFAHATLEVKQATIKSGYKMVLRVPHGCGSAPTLKVRVQIPEGYIGVKPMPKAGWTLETVRGKYAKEYDNEGGKVSEGVKEIIWTGSLQNDHYDEFIANGSIAAGLEPGSTLYFPAVQECEKASERWIEIPQTGGGRLRFPAPALKLVAPAN